MKFFKINIPARQLCLPTSSQHGIYVPSCQKLASHLLSIASNSQQLGTATACVLCTRCSNVAVCG